MNNSETFQFQVYENNNNNNNNNNKKQNLNTKLGKMGLRATHPASSQSAGFPDKAIIPCPDKSSPIYQSVESSTSLDSETSIASGCYNSPP